MSALPSTWDAKSEGAAEQAASGIGRVWKLVEDSQGNLTVVVGGVIGRAELLIALGNVHLIVWVVGVEAVADLGLLLVGEVVHAVPEHPRSATSCEVRTGSGSWAGFRHSPRRRLGVGVRRIGGESCVSLTVASRADRSQSRRRSGNSRPGQASRLRPWPSPRKHGGAADLVRLDRFLEQRLPWGAAPGVVDLERHQASLTQANEYADR